MGTPLSIRIETTSAGKGLLPWVSVARRGRYLTESQFFALLGFNENELAELSAPEQEDARDTLEFALRLLTAFEYIPKDHTALEQFFERKLIAFEQRLRSRQNNTITLQAALGLTLSGTTLFAATGDIAVLHITDSTVANLGERDSGSPFRFGTFHSGMLLARSCLLFLPKHLAALFKADELKSLPLSRGSEQKLAYLERLAHNRAIGAINFQALLLEAKSRPFKSDLSTESSISHLLKTEATTEELLSPPLLKPFLKWLHVNIKKGLNRTRFLIDTYKTRTIPSRIKNHYADRERLGGSSPYSSSIIEGIGDSHAARENRGASLLKRRQEEAAVSLATATRDEPERGESRLAGSTKEQRVSLAGTDSRTFSSHLLHLMGWGRRTFGASRALVRGKIQIAPAYLAQGLRLRLGKVYSRSIERFNVLPFKSKILFIVILTLLFASAEGILLTSRKNAVVRAEIALQEEMVAIRGLIDTANAAAIYADEEKARTMVRQAKNRIENLPVYRNSVTTDIPLRYIKAAPTKKDLEELNASLSDLAERLRRVVTIDNPSVVIDASELEGSKGIIFKDGSVFVWNENTLLQSREGIIQKMTIAAPQNIEQVLPQDTRSMLLLIDGATAYPFNHLDQKAGEPTELRGPPQAATLYRRRLYTLHPTENQIYRYEPTRTGFDGGTPWIIDGTHISDARSIAIDGSVYVLHNNGTVTELRKGAKIDFAPKGVDPALSAPTKLWTSENSEYLYLLEPSQKRLLVLAKPDGALQAQYVSPVFNDLQDFAVDETKKTAYLFDGLSVVAISLSHFTSK